MLTLYYSKNSSAFAAHILLEEVGATYDAVEVPIAQGAHRQPEFLAQFPKGRIPGLGTPDGPLSENPAILEYIAAQHPAAGMLPQGTFAQAQARSFCAYIAATAHVVFAHGHRGARWARHAASHQDMAEMMPQNLAECAVFLEQDLALSPWAMGETCSYCDPYLFMFCRTLSIADIAIAQFPRLAAHEAMMAARPATQRVLAMHEMG